MTGHERSAVTEFVMDDGVIVTVTHDPTFMGPPARLTSIYARRFTREQITWLRDEIVDVLVVDPPDAEARCIGYRTNQINGTERRQALVTAAAAGGGVEIALEGFPGFGDWDD